MTTDQPTEDTGQVRPFAAVLQDIEHGTLADQLAIDVQQLVKAVRDLGRKGTLTLKVEVAPRKGGNALNVTARRDLKLPQEEPVESVFFTDKSGNLLRDDPRQMALPLRQVERPAPAADTELRRAGQ